MAVHGWTRFLLVSAALCAALVAAAPAPAVLFSTFTASSTADEPDNNPGDGLCLTASGSCTLRAAVQEASALTAAVTRINLLAGATYTLTRLGPNEDQAATGDLDLGVGPGIDNITIAVPGGHAVVQGGPGWDDRVFDVHDNAFVALSALDIRGGNAAFQTGGGGILNAGNMTVTNSTVSGNAAYQAGGIANIGAMSLTSTIVSLNQAGAGNAGGIMNLGRMSVTSSTVSGNSAASLGGGIDSDGPLEVTNSTVSLNRAGAGGGLLTSAPLTLTGSTVSGNTSRFGDGGGIYVWPAGSLTARNSTISTNAARRHGGGIYNLASANLDGVTIADNVADSNGDGDGDAGGISNVSGGVVSVSNTIVADNVDASGTSKFPDCLGSLTSLGFNLVENTSGCAIDLSLFAQGNITGRDPRLGPLQANGGATFTHVPLLSDGKLGPSPAIDSGNPTSGCSGESQNGVTRPQDGNGDGIARCDIGACEVPRQTFTLGTWALTPTDTTAQVGERISYSLTWTAPPPRGWRSLDTLQLRFVDDEQTALGVRFQEVPGSPGTFSVVDPESGKTGPSFAPGRPNKLESNAATVYLSDSSVDGPPGTRITLTLTLGFKPKAAGHTYDVQVLATDDIGETQGFHRAGTIAVAR